MTKRNSPERKAMLQRRRANQLARVPDYVFDTIEEEIKENSDDHA